MKWKEVVANALVIVGLSGPLYGFALERSYQVSLPHSPEPTTGHAIPRNNHGVVVYYTESEVSQLRNLWVGGGLIGLLGGLIHKYGK